MRLIISIVLTVMIASVNTVFAADRSSYLVEAYGDKCKHGLHPQPNNGPFSIFLFCDDALGANIGIILTERGAGPGNIPLSEDRTWGKWDVNDRFWQDRKWATDVISFAWSPSNRYLYVLTEEIYGDQGLYRLDLRERKFVIITPHKGFYTRILTFDANKKKMILEVQLEPSEKPILFRESIDIE